MTVEHTKDTVEAAAYEMLEALEALLGGCGFCDCRPSPWCLCTDCQQAQAAIARAKGQVREVRQ